VSEASEVALRARWEEIALELGHVVIEWSKIEFYLSRIFAGITGATEPVAVLLSRRLAGSGMDAIVGSLLATLPPAEAGPIKSWLRDVKALRERRNTLLHGTLVNQSDGEAWHATNIEYSFNKSTGEASFIGTRLVASDLRAFRAEMKVLAEAYTKLPPTARRGVIVGD
jgi:hypothetical protein